MMEHEKLLGIIKGGQRLLIFLHDNPDPDAIASGWILSCIAASAGVRSRIVHGKSISRAENQAMVQLLKIPVQSLDDVQRPIRFMKTDRYALVDTQPGAGNNAFPDRRLQCNIVIDHHPAKSDVRADLLDIRPDQGCCATMLLDYLQACGIEPSPELATAAAYAIISETQDLGREATRYDRKALSLLMPKARLPILGRIRHPPRDREYYRTVARAMQGVRLGKNICVCHIGAVQTSGIVAEIADFLVAMDRITWCMVTGLHNNAIVLSIRSTRRRANAEKVVKRMLRNRGKGGGHNMMAGGSMPCSGLGKYRELTESLTRTFVKQLHRNMDVMRPLIDESR